MEFIIKIFLQLKKWFLAQKRKIVLRKVVLYCTRSHSKIIEVYGVAHLLDEPFSLELINELVSLDYVSFDGDVIKEDLVLKFVGKPTWYEKTKYGLHHWS